MSEHAAAEGIEMMPRHGEFCWTEIATDDLESCRRFYAEVFGWDFKRSENSEIDMEYLEFGSESGRTCGGMYEINAECFGGSVPPPHISIYIAVDDVDDAASKAFDLGATIVVPPTDIPGVGRFCQVKDPAGAPFSMVALRH